MLFDTTTTQEQDLRHPMTKSSLSYYIIICDMPTSVENVAASLSFGAYNETDNTGQVARLLATRLLATVAEFISMQLLFK